MKLQSKVINAIQDSWLVNELLVNGVNVHSISNEIHNMCFLLQQNFETL
jgi:hypothetical protein